MSDGHLNQFNNLTEPARKKAIVALERRFGQSMLPYSFRRLAPHRWRVRDDESGSHIEFDFRAGRLVVLAERDSATQYAEASK